MKLCRENCDRDARYNAAWARAQATVELERKALAEELARKEAAEDQIREAAADAIFAEEARRALAPTAPAKLSVAAALALFQAKAATLAQQVEELEALKVAQEHVKALESRIAELKSELNIE